MIQFLQPIGSLVLGIILAVYGFMHALLNHPPVTAFRQFVDSLPVLLTIVIFLLALTAICSGLALLISGSRGLRRRILEIRSAYATSPYRAAYDPYGDDEDPYTLHPRDPRNPRSPG